MGQATVILIDHRVGLPSVDRKRGMNRMDAAEHFAAKLSPSQVEQLEYGDCCFTGVNGTLIGIELKKIDDCVNGLLSGRFADIQLPGMLQMYDVSYLIVEGYYRCDPESGLVQGWRGQAWRDIQSGRQRLTWSALDGWLTSMETLGGLRVRRTVTEQETVRTIQSLHDWWQKDDHKSLKVFNTAADAAAIDRPGLLRRMAAELPLVGWQRSADVARHFGTIRTMVNASASEWLKIDGIGAGIADKVVKAINGGDV